MSLGSLPGGTPPPTNGDDETSRRLPVLPDDGPSPSSTGTEAGGDLSASRRAFLRTAAAAGQPWRRSRAAGRAWRTSSGKRFKELSPDEVARVLATDGAPQQGTVREGDHTSGPTAPLRGRRVRVRARPLPLRRLPPLRLRLREGEQPVARAPADPVDPGAGDGQGARRGPRPTPTSTTRRTRSRSPGSSTSRCSASSAGTTVREDLPDPGHLEGAGRHRGHRLRLVHRLPLLHVGLPLRRPPLQLGRRPPCRPPS